MQDRLKKIEEDADKLHREAYPDLYSKDSETVTEVKVEQSAGGKETEFETENFEQKYKALKGKYDAELPRLHLELARERELRSALEATKANPQTDVELNLDGEEVELLKEEYPDIYEGVKAMLNGKKTAPKEEVKVEKAEQVKWAEADHNYLSVLAPKWQELNSNPEFLKWLDMKDRYARKTRKELLNDAYNSRSIETVANFFNDYDQFVVGSKKEEKKEDEVEVEVAPETTSSSFTTKDNKPIVSRAEVHKFYTDVAQGKYNGKQAEMQKQESLINQAAAEGRIR